jgi:hypothetical protein
MQAVAGSRNVVICADFDYWRGSTLNFTGYGLSLIDYRIFSIKIITIFFKFNLKKGRSFAKLLFLLSKWNYTYSD